MFSISIPFPPPRDRRKQKGRRQKAASSEPPQRRQAAGAAPPPPRPKPAWDATRSDLDRYRLNEAEQAFRRELRQSRHRLRPASQASQPEELHDNVGAAQEEWEAPSLAGGPAEELAGAPQGGGEDAGAESDTSSASLGRIRAFVAQLQRTYGLAGAAEQQPDAEAAEGAEAPVWQEDVAAAPQAAPLPQAAQLGAAAVEEGGGYAAALSGRHASSHAEHQEGSDSEGEGHLGPAALRRAQRLHTTAPHTAAVAAPPGSTACQPQLPRADPAQQALAARLEAAEAQLGRCAGLEAELQQARDAVAQLQAQQAQMQTDLNDYVSHTSTLLTSLQSQLSKLMATQPGGSAALEPQRPPSPAVPHAAAVPVAVVQARAAAEALAIAQAAQARAAAGAGNPEAEQPRPADALAAVQLPSFRRFAELRGLAAAASKPAEGGAAAASTPGEAAYLAAAGRRSGGGGNRSAENSPPQPRVLPQSLQRWAGGGAPPQPGGGAAGFDWRPLSATG